MKKNSFGLVLIGLLFIIFNSCKKEKAMEPCNICNKDTSFEAMKEWYYFKEGSWWVYEEENSGDTDSVYVFESLLDDDVEAFEYRTYSTWYDNDFIYRHNPGYIGGSNVNSCQIRRFDRSQASAENVVGASLIANFPILLGESSGNFNTFATGGGVWTDSVGISITSGNQDFTNVVMFHLKGVGSENNDTTNFYMAKNFGIIRKEIFDINKTWNLIDYYIIQ